MFTNKRLYTQNVANLVLAIPSGPNFVWHISPPICIEDGAHPILATPQGRNLFLRAHILLVHILLQMECAVKMPFTSSLYHLLGSTFWNISLQIGIDNATRPILIPPLGRNLFVQILLKIRSEHVHPLIIIPPPGPNLPLTHFIANGH